MYCEIYPSLEGIIDRVKSQYSIFYNDVLLHPSRCGALQCFLGLGPPAVTQPPECKLRSRDAGPITQRSSQIVLTGLAIGRLGDASVLDSVEQQQLTCGRGEAEEKSHLMVETDRR